MVEENFQSRTDEKEARRLFSETARNIGISGATLQVMAGKMLKRKYDEGKIYIDIIHKEMDIQ